MITPTTINNALFRPSKLGRLVPHSGMSAHVVVGYQIRGEIRVKSHDWSYTENTRMLKCELYSENGERMTDIEGMISKAVVSMHAHAQILQLRYNAQLKQAERIFTDKDLFKDHVKNIYEKLSKIPRVYVDEIDGQRVHVCETANDVFRLNERGRRVQIPEIA